MFFRMHEAGDSVERLSHAYDIQPRLIEASITLCRDRPDILSEYDESHS